MPSTPFRKPRHSLEAFDRLLERAFAPREIPTTGLSIIAVPEQPPSPTTPFYSPVDGSFPISVGDTSASLDPIWEEVRETKALELAASPSKVKSLEGQSRSRSPQSKGDDYSREKSQERPQANGKRKVVTKRRSR